MFEKRKEKKEMALINCPECKNQVSSTASSCPKCGAPIAGSTGAGTPLTTTQLTSKRLKMQVVFSALTFWIGLIWLIFAIVAASQGNASDGAPVVPGIITFIGAVWGITTKLRIWWHHK